MARVTGAVKHTHQYYRERISGLWHCSGIDGCTHYLPKNMPPPVGRKSICWGPCEKPFLLTPVNMKNDKPMCDACSDNIEFLDKYLEERMPEPEDKLAASLRKIREKAAQKDEIEVIEPDEPTSE